MPKFYTTLPPTLAHWALAQPIFFISTAPTSGEHINLSPKGLRALSFSSISPKTTLAYVDRTGSGCETLSHVYENRRACIMFCSFGPTPRILRLYLKMTRVVEYTAPEFEDCVLEVQRNRSRNWMEGMEEEGEGEKERGYPVPIPGEEGRDTIPPGARAVLYFDVFKAQTSCGFAVPQIRPDLFTPDGELQVPIDDKDFIIPPGTTGLKPTELSCFLHRSRLTTHSEGLEKKGLLGPYRIKNNCRSLDGLPGLRAARVGRGENIWLVDLGFRLKAAVISHGFGIAVGFLLALAFFYLCLMAGVIQVQLVPSSSTTDPFNATQTGAPEVEGIIRSLLAGNWYHGGKTSLNRDW